MVKIFVCIELNERTLKKAIAIKCDKIIFVKQTFLPSEHLPLALINANHFEAESYEETFAANKNFLEKFRKLSPDFFLYKNIPLLEAINKDLFWATRYEGMLRHAVKQYAEEGDEVIYEKHRYYILKKWIALFKVGLIYLNNLFFSAFWPELKTPAILRNKNYGFIIADKFELTYFHGLFCIFPPDSCVWIANFSSSRNSELLTRELLIQHEIAKLRYRNFQNKLSIKDINNGIKILGIHNFFSVSQSRQNLINTINITTKILDSGISVLFLVAQENTGFGNVIALLIKQLGKVAVNSHNGVKTSFPYNRDNYFTIWCCWDEQMKKLLHEECGIDKEQLVVTGHLMEDIARKHTYENSFNGFYCQAEEKKIISLFSTNENPVFKWQTVNALIELVKSRNDLQLLIRLHPSENPSEWQQIKEIPVERIKLIFPQNNEDKTLLYDQLSISDVSIVFGSTVAIESSWFDVPSITVEAKERSMLYAVDNEKIFHERTIPDAVHRMELLLNEKKNIISHKSSVTQKIKEEVIKRKEQIIKSKSSLYFFTARYPYPGEAFIDNEIKVFSDLFIRINVFPGTQGTTLPEILQNVKVNFLPVKIPGNIFTKFFILLSNFRLIFRILKDEFSINRISIFFKYLRNNLSIILHAIQYANYFSENTPIRSASDIFYSFWMNEWALMLSILKYKRKIHGFVFRVHGYDLYDHLRPDHYIPFKKFNMRMCDKVFTACRAATLHLKSQNIFSEKILLSHLGVLDNGINPFEPKETFTIVSCSSTNFNKRVHEIPAALKHLDFELRWVHFGGDGYPISLNDVRKKCERLPNHIRWELKGAVPNEELINFYKCNSVNLFLHLTFTEGGVPVVLQEATSFGIPLLSTSVGGCPEIVNEKTGILIDKEFKPTDVAKIISEFRNSKMNTQEFREGVKEFWKENFDAEKNYKIFFHELCKIDSASLLSG